MSDDLSTILLEARRQIDTNDLAGAEATLLQGRKSFPDSVDLIAGLGNIRLAQGRLNKAAADFRSAIVLSPKKAGYHVALAGILQTTRDTAGAIDALQKAVALEPDNPALRSDLGILLRQTGRKNEAVQSLQQAVNMAPDQAYIHSNLARVLQDIGDLDPARKAVEQALDIDSESPDALINLGCILRDLKQPHEAVLAFRKAAAINPALPDVWLNLALALRDSGKAEQGLEALETLLKLDPESAGGHTNIGRLQHGLHCYPEAAEAFRTALHLSPSDPSTMASFAALLIDMDQLDEAETWCNKARQIQPDHVPAITNLGILACQRGDQKEALCLLRSALEIDPHNIQTQRNLADPLFLSGHLEDGWAAYEYRWKLPDRPRRPHPQPEWQGEDLTGKTLLVWPEQGVGDTLMFSTCLPDVMAAADKVIFEVDQRFVSLYQRSFPDLTVLPRLDPPHAQTLEENIDLQCPVGGLGRWTRKTLDSFPRKKHFLRADPERTSWWQQQLATMGNNRVKVGLYWRSSGEANAVHSAYPALENWLPVLQKPGLDVINLQYGEDGERLAVELGNKEITVHQPAEIDLFNDIDDIAALTAALDAYVGPTTLTAWLTAATGTPALVAGLPGDWVTMNEDCLPWLPQAHYFARAPRGTWTSAIGALASELDTIIREKADNDV
jgi:Flp pilus assembly protein TadD